MKARELATLLMLRPDENVSIFWDSAPRGFVDAIYRDPDPATGVVIVGEWHMHSRNRTAETCEIIYES